jgi:membrane protein YqaA with SNARE-associated domain
MFGLLILGILDSSFLFLPFGNDLLLISLVSSTDNLFDWISYVVMSAIGSLIGVSLIDLVVRRTGESSLEKFVKPKKLERLKSRMNKNAGWTIFSATLIPPPFPFTAVVITASALQCSRTKIFSAVFVGRLLRFTAEALLAIYFGKQVLKFLNSEIVKYGVYALILIAVVGSIFSVRKWLSTRRPSAEKKESMNV